MYKVSRFYSFLRSHCTVVKRMQVATLSRGTSFLRRNGNVICGTGFPLNAFLRWQKRNRKQRHRVSLGHDSASRNLAEICCFVESKGKGPLCNDRSWRIKCRRGGSSWFRVFKVRWIRGHAGDKMWDVDDIYEFILYLHHRRSDFHDAV